jgi:hypothetical protein
MCVYINSLLPTANMAWPKYNQKLASVHEANMPNIFYRIFEQITFGKTSFSVSPAVSRQTNA